MKWNKGDIVKIGRTGRHVTHHWVGFTSKLVSQPYKGDPDNFRMSYGNFTREEYSEMNFFDCNVIVEPTDEEIKIYEEVLPKYIQEFENKNSNQVEVLGIREDSSYSNNHQIEIGDLVEIEPYFNVFNGDIYARAISKDVEVKVWSKDNGLILSKRKYLLI